MVLVSVDAERKEKGKRKENRVRLVTPLEQLTSWRYPLSLPWNYQALLSSLLKKWRHSPLFSLCPLPTWWTVLHMLSQIHTHMAIQLAWLAWLHAPSPLCKLSLHQAISASWFLSAHSSGTGDAALWVLAKSGMKSSLSFPNEWPRTMKIVTP